LPLHRVRSLRLIDHPERPRLPDDAGRLSRTRLTAAALGNRSRRSRPARRSRGC
jgi:hypothetical protein